MQFITAEILLAICNFSAQIIISLNSETPNTVLYVTGKIGMVAIFTLAMHLTKFGIKIQYYSRNGFNQADIPFEGRVV